jgi:serine/threonine protein kinase
MEVDLHPLGIPLTIPLKKITVPFDMVPSERLTGEIIERDGKHRCKIDYMRVINQGTYGVIKSAKRDGKIVAVKRPTGAAGKDSLLAEGVVQWLAAQVLSREGIPGAIPEVYDIFRHGDHARFSMEYIEGQSALEAIYRSFDPDHTFIQCLSQVCVILSILEDRIHLDHRDLKMTNLWIRRKPIRYSAYGVEAPFQVVVLDFGFACLGNGEGGTVVNLGDVIPDIDPCPKDGRDLYQCIMSLWSVEEVRSRLSASMQAEVKTWIEGVKGGSARIAESSSSLEWSYMLTSHPKFSHSLLRPERLLKRLQAL